MAVRAYRAQIIDGVEFVLLADLRQGLEMVDVNETFSQWPVLIHEVKPSDDARDAPMFDAFPPGVGIALVHINSNRFLCSFEYLLRLNDLLGEDFWVSRRAGPE